MKLSSCAFFGVAVCSSILLFVNCSRDGLPSEEEQLVGRWEWVETSTAPNASKLTPAITGHTSTIEFDRRGRARFYQDGHLTGAANFMLRHGLRRKKNQHLLIYHGYKGQQYYRIKGNRLYLRETDANPSDHVFNRSLPASATSSLHTVQMNP